MLGLPAIDLCHLPTIRVPDHTPIVILIQSERLKQSTSPKNQSAKHPDSGCLGISEDVIKVVIGSALSKGSRSGPEAFRAGYFKDSKPEIAHEKPLAPRVRDDSSFGKLTNSCNVENVSFSLLLVTFSIKANFEREYMCKSIYLRFPRSLKPSSSICYVLFSSEENYCGALLLFHKIPLKLN